MARRTTEETDKTGRYNADRCRATRRLRTRLRVMTEQVEALEAELRDVRADIADERAALNAYLSSPEAELAQMQAAQELVQSAALDAVRRHAQCPECGGLGRGMTQNLLGDQIKAHCKRHGLTAQAAPIREWPDIGQGHSRRTEWLAKPRRQREMRVW